jgi:hypothetical protein
MRNLFRTKLAPFVVVAALALVGGTAVALGAHGRSQKPAVAPAQAAAHGARGAQVRLAAATVKKTTVKKAKAAHVVAQQSDPTSTDEQDNEVEGQDDNEVDQPEADDDDQGEVEQDDQGDNNDDQGDNNDDQGESDSGGSDD